MYLKSTVTFASILPLLCSLGQACSRVNYDSGEGGNHRIIVGRTMDWLADTNSSVWVFPAGMDRDGCAGVNSWKWKSKYGSVVTSMYDRATVDGMNSEGLVGNLLYLADGDYGERNSSRPGLSLGVWLQYFLDRYATVAEAVDDLYTPSGAETFQIVTKEIIKNVPSLCHVGLSDAGGDSAILEYIDGRLVVHHSRQYKVMTNDPPYDQQLAIDQYWNQIGMYALPGTDRPADRFARLAYYVRVASDSLEDVTAVSTTAGMMRAVSVPMRPISISTPNIAPTLWRTYADTLALRYYFEGAREPMVLWVELTELDLSETGQVLLLTLNNTWTERVGDMTKNFVPAEPFAPLRVDDPPQRTARPKAWSEAQTEAIGVWLAKKLPSSLVKQLF